MEGKFIGTVSKNCISPMVTNIPWAPIALTSIPYPVVSPPPSSFFYLGSANTSMATTSIGGISYNAGVDIFRWDNNKVDVDRYIAHPYANYYCIYYIQPPHHHLKVTDKVFRLIPPNLQSQICHIKNL